MMDFLSHAPLAFAAGLISVLSPCVMPLMPAYLSLISGISVEDMEQSAGDAVQRRRVMRACTGFVLGFSCVFILMGVGIEAGRDEQRVSPIDLAPTLADFAGAPVPDDLDGVSRKARSR